MIDNFTIERSILYATRDYAFKQIYIATTEHIRQHIRQHIVMPSIKAPVHSSIGRSVSNSIYIHLLENTKNHLQ